MIKGSFSKCCLPSLLITILKLQKTGRLSIHQENKGFSLYFSSGKLAYVTTLWGKYGLGKYISDKAILEQNILEQLYQKESIQPLEQQLNKLQVFSQAKLLELMAKSSLSIIHKLDFLMRGDFVFIEGNPPFPLPKKRISVISLMINKSRQIKSLDDLLPLLEPFDATPELDRSSNGFQTLLKIKLSAQEGFILSRIDGYLDFNRIFAFCGPNRLETARFLILLQILDLLKYKKGSQYIKSTMQQHFLHAMNLFKPIPVKMHQENSSVKKVDNSDVGQLEDQDNSDAGQLEDQVVISEISEKLQEFNKMNYYQILGVKPDTSVGTIKKAYFSLAKKYHPDNYYRRLGKKEQELTDEIFNLIKSAYEVLSNTDIRAKYDKKILNKSKSSNVTTSKTDTTAQRKISSEYQYNQALKLMKQREYSRALEFLKAAHEFDPTNGVVLAKYAEAEYLTGRNLPSAESHVKQALKLLPKEGLVHLLLAKIYFRRKRYELADKSMKKALLYEPESPEVKTMLFQLKEVKNQMENSNKKGFLNKLFNK